MKKISLALVFVFLFCGLCFGQDENVDNRLKLCSLVEQMSRLAMTCRYAGDTPFEVKETLVESFEELNINQEMYDGLKAIVDFVVIECFKTGYYPLIASRQIDQFANDMMSTCMNAVYEDK